MTGRMEIVARVSGRRKWTTEQKLEILRDAFGPGGSVLERSPHSGALFAFRGKRGDLVKLLWYDGQGLCLFSKRMDRGRFVWPMTKTGAVSLTAAQLSMLLEGIDWRRPERTWQPSLAG